MGKILLSNGISICQIKANTDDRRDMTYMSGSDSDKDPKTYILSLYSMSNNGPLQTFSPLLSGTDLVVYKKIGFNSPWKYVGNFKNVRGFKDANLLNRTPIQYRVQTFDTGVTLSSFITDFYRPNWSSWSIQDLRYNSEQQVWYAEDDIFIFKGNVEAGNFDSLTTTIQYNTLGRYGIVYKGATRYEKGSLSCLFGNFEMAQRVTGSTMCVLYELSTDYDPQTYDGYYLYINEEDIPDLNSTPDFPFPNPGYYQAIGGSWRYLPDGYIYVEDATKLSEWYEFLYNNQPKLLRDPYGNRWIVAITDGINRLVDYRSNVYPTRISFGWQEVMDVSETPIINTVVGDNT